MRPRLLTVLAALAAAASFTAVAAPADAATLPIGSGVWGPSNNVSGTAGCTANHTSDGPCTMFASSTDVAGRETCTSATTIIGPPTVTVEFGCHVVFTATVSLTGAGSEVGTDPVDIESGACAGLTLSDAELTITDGATGTTVVHPRVAVVPSGWKFEGNFVAANVSTLTAYVVHAVGKIAPACTRVVLRTGETSTLLYGMFQGSYQFI